MNGTLNLRNHGTDLKNSCFTKTWCQSFWTLGAKRFRFSQVELVLNHFQTGFLWIRSVVQLAWMFQTTTDSLHTRTGRCGQKCPHDEHFRVSRSSSSTIITINVQSLFLSSVKADYSSWRNRSVNCGLNLTNSRTFQKYGDFKTNLNNAISFTHHCSGATECLSRPKRVRTKRGVATSV